MVNIILYTRKTDHIYAALAKFLLSKLLIQQLLQERQVQCGTLADCVLTDKAEAMQVRSFSNQLGCSLQCK